MQEQPSTSPDTFEEAARAQQAAVEAAVFLDELRAHKPLATYALMAVSILVFLAMVATGVSPFMPTRGDILAWGADHGPQTTSGEWWRLLTSAFVHIGIVHIAFNMWCLKLGGALCELLQGRAVFVATYVISAVGGSLVSIHFNPEVVSAGASGAVFGVFGALLVVAQRGRRALPPQMLVGIKKWAGKFLLINLAIGFAVPFIDNAAHIGGLVFGAAWGFLASRARPSIRWWLPRAGLLVASLAVLAWTSIGRAWPGANLTSLRHYGAGEEAAERGDWDTVVREATSAIELSPEWPLAYALRAGAYANTDEVELARTDFDRASELADALGNEWISVQINYEDAHFRWRNGELVRARKLLDAVLRYNPEFPNAWFIRGLVYQEMDGKLRYAIEDFGRAIELQPDWAEAYQARGDAHLENLDAEAAEADHARARRLRGE